VNPQIGGTGTDKLTLEDLNGQAITNPTCNTPGFAGCDGMPAAVSLAHVADMEEHGVPGTHA
jgi:hypothetical protein